MRSVNSTVESMFHNNRLVNPRCPTWGPRREVIFELESVNPSEIAAPPQAGDALPPLPEPWKCETAMRPQLFTADQMRAYARAALEGQG